MDARPPVSGGTRRPVVRKIDAARMEFPCGRVRSDRFFGGPFGRSTLQQGPLDEPPHARHGDARRKRGNAAADESRTPAQLPDDGQDNRSDDDLTNFNPKVECKERQPEACAVGADPKFPQHTGETKSVNQAENKGENIAAARGRATPVPCLRGPPTVACWASRWRW